MNKPGIYSRFIAAGISVGAAVAGVLLIIPHEGEVLGTYLDPVGIITSCHGHTGPDLKLGQVFTREECLDQLAEDLEEHDAQMMKHIKVPITEYQHAALLSFCYNVGVGACSRSTLFSKLNDRDYRGACNELSRWVYAQGKRLNGLVRRRAAEMAMCLGHIPPSVEIAQ